MSITVYSKPNCPQCDMTKRELSRLGVSYDSIDISQDDAAMQLVRDLNHRQVPVVVAGENNWSGFRPDLISGLAAAI